jgi:type II secretory pathway pseudopilin PulG
MKDHARIRLMKKPGEEGYVLLGVIILLALFMIAMAVAAPKVAKEIQRDRDLETMHRGKQYIRAIQLYYKKFHAYPPNIDALVKTNEIRFLRKRYIDPTTGKDDWKPIYFGQNKTPMAMGFFGQPLGGTGGAVLAGTGPGGVGSTIGTSIGQNPAQPNPSNPQSPGSNQGSNQGSNPGSGDSGSSSSDSGNSGMTGGGAIIGVSPASTKQSIYVYKTKNHYNEWEFLYSPQMDQPGMAGGSTIQPTSGSSFGGTNPPTTPSPTPTPNPSPTPAPQQ